MTDKIPLPGGRIPDKNNWKNYEEITVDELVNNFNIDNETATHLVRTYGSNTEHVVNLAKELNLFEKILPNEPYILAEVYYCIRNEYCQHLVDFFWLRTFIALETDFSSCIDKVADIFSKELNWPQEKLNNEKNIVRNRLNVAQFK